MAILRCFLTKRSIRFAAETIPRVILAAVVAKISRGPFRGLLFCAPRGQRRTNAVDSMRQFSEAIEFFSAKPEQRSLISPVGR